ncbi:MAG: carboxypeptidase-like regulatory domain-containing protein, partial [Blastocatellia bacterium]
MRRSGMLLVILTNLAWMSGVVWAQNQNGTIRGLVTGPTGEVVSGVTVRLVAEETAAGRSAVTGVGGNYAFTLLPPGSYRIEIEQGGGAKYLYRAVLQVNQDLRIDIGFSGTMPQAMIEVVESLTPLKRETASQGVVIDNDQVTGLPLDGRNFLQLALLAPGAVPAAPGSAGSVRGDFTFNINGAREDANNYLL